MFVCRDLLANLKTDGQDGYQCLQGSIDCTINKVANDSRKAGQDDLFICIKGAKNNGHDHAKEVVEKGVKVLVVEDEIAITDKEVTIIKVEDTRYAMALISAAYFGDPAKALTVIGITGTKGKTTTTYLIKSILERAGHKVGLIGTIETIIGTKRIPAVNTTPESFALQKYFREMVDAGCKIVVMETASQGFKLHRTAGIEFAFGVFTNLEPDHIGPNEHADFDEYLDCKRRLFKQCKVGIVNRDDPHWEAVTAGHSGEIESYGIDQPAELRASDLNLVSRSGILGMAFRVSGRLDFAAEVAMPGRFSVYNALAAIAVCRHFDVPVPIIRQALWDARVRGRIEMYPVAEEFTLMIDYAHNAMGLESLLKSLKEYQPKRLVCLFGCGGNRDRNRRFEMGEVSGRWADLTVITSDNPRNEEPQAIIDDIRAGIAKTAGKGNYVEIIDRRKAIAFCLKNAQPGDVIVLAGKGHEDYQEIAGEKKPMDERDIIDETVKDILGRCT